MASYLDAIRAGNKEIISDMLCQYFNADLNASLTSLMILELFEHFNKEIAELLFSHSSIKELASSPSVIDAMTSMMQEDKEEKLLNILPFLSLRKTQWILSSIERGHNRIVEFLLEEDILPIKAQYIIQAVNYQNHEALLLILNDGRCHSGHVKEKVVRKALHEKRKKVAQVFMTHIKIDGKIKDRYARVYSELLASEE